MVSYSHFVMERPPAMLAAVELSLVVNGVHDQVKGGSPSAFGADNGATFAVGIVIVCHHVVL